MDNDEVRISQLATQLHSEIENQLSLLTDNSANSQSLLNSIQQFQPSPQLLHKGLDNYIDTLLKSYLDPDCNAIPAVCEVFYTFSKVVGTKKILNFMKTDINLLPLLISKFDNKPLHWHEEYLLLCFLVVLSYAPFSLDSLEGEVKDSLYSIGYSYLQTSGPLQPLGSRLLGTLIIRDDCCGLFTLFINDLLTKYEDSDDVSKNGLLQTLNIALQNDTNSKFMDQSTILCSFLHSIEPDLSKAAYLGKIYSKLARYLSELEEDEKNEDILQFFDSNFSNRSTETRIILSKKFTKMLLNIDPCFGIDVVLDLIEGTKALLANEPMETMNAEFLHSQLLIIAELLRLKLIDRNSYSDIQEIVSKTLFFQQQRMTYISGSNIRDASNYIIWSLARAEKELDPDIVKSLVLNLFFVSTFDKEILIRRASTAALQELIGRHGLKTWKHFYSNIKDEDNSIKSVKIIEILDFVELGSIEKSYLKMPLQLIGIFPDFKPNFFEFLIENCFNLDNELVKLSAKSLSNLLRGESDFVVQKVLSSLIIRSTVKVFNGFIGISEILPLTKDFSQLKDILPIFNDIKLNRHKDPPFILEAYLLLLNALLKLEQIPDNDFYENLFNAIRVDTDSISLILRELAPSLKLNKQNWEKWIHYMKNNNMNTSKAVSYLSCFKANFGDVLELLNNERTDCNVKSSIIKSITQFLKGDNLSNEQLEELINQLDDYTTSEQGDIGSKSRIATIDLIASNLNKFKPLMGIFEPKLLRLSAESIDRVRIDSLTLIMKTKGLVFEEIPRRDLELYYQGLLNLYYQYYINNKEMSKEFWKGYIFSGGALKATDNLITSSLRAFVEFYERKLNDDEKKEVLLQLASILKIDPTLLKGNSMRSQRLNKIIVVGLQFYSRILQLGILIPESFNLKGLFVRIYNLHLNTQSIPRLSCSIKIFGYLIAVHNLKESRERLVWLITNHPISRVRVLAADELFTAYTEKALVENNGKYKEALGILGSIDCNEKGLQKYSKALNVE